MKLSILKMTLWIGMCFFFAYRREAGEDALLSAAWIMAGCCLPAYALGRFGKQVKQVRRCKECERKYVTYD